MRLLGFDISRRKALPPPRLSGVDDTRGWVRIFDSHTGAWQQDAAHEVTDVFAQTTVFACITLIARDIGKLRVRLVEKRPNSRLWTETTSPAYSPVLRKPNHYQTRQQFIECWMVSKLSEGNTYALKERDARGVVVRMYVLDPRRVQPLVAPDGSVYYRLAEDDLNKLPTHFEAVPASEIIHDRMVCLFHPLVGVTPLYAATLPALQALQIQNKSKSFFANGSQPGGILTAPAKISEENARRIKEHWERNYTGTNVGRVAVLGDGLAYTPGAVNAVDSQLVEQLGLTAKQVCAVFHVPPFMVGAADAPPYGNIGPAVQQYYNQCLQSPIESLEACLDEGLGIGEGVKVEGRELGTDLDLGQLLRMDMKSQAEVEGLLVQRGIHSPDESREVFGKPPVEGGAQPYLQQQNYSLSALSRRDGRDDPFGSGPTAPPALPAPTPEDEAAARDQADERALQNIRRMVEVVRTMQPAADDQAHQDGIAAAVQSSVAPLVLHVEQLAGAVQEIRTAQRSTDATLAGAVHAQLQPVADAVAGIEQKAEARAEAREQERAAEVLRLAAIEATLASSAEVIGQLAQAMQPIKELQRIADTVTAQQQAIETLRQAQPLEDTAATEFMRALSAGFSSAEPACV